MKPRYKIYFNQSEFKAHLVETFCHLSFFYKQEDGLFTLILRTDK